MSRDQPSTRDRPPRHRLRLCASRRLVRRSVLYIVRPELGGPPAPGGGGPSCPSSRAPSGTSVRSRGPGAGAAPSASETLPCIAATEPGSDDSCRGFGAARFAVGTGAERGRSAAISGAGAGLDGGGTGGTSTMLTTRGCSRRSRRRGPGHGQKHPERPRVQEQRHRNRGPERAPTGATRGRCRLLPHVGEHAPEAQRRQARGEGRDRPARRSKHDKGSRLPAKGNAVC